VVTIRSQEVPRLDRRRSWGPEQNRFLDFSMKPQERTVAIVVLDQLPRGLGADGGALMVTESCGAACPPRRNRNALDR